MFALLLVLMASHDFSSINLPPKFDGLNFPIWKVKITLFLKSLGVRVDKAIPKEFVEPHGDEDTCSEATTKDYEANAKAQYELTQVLNDDLSCVIIANPHLKFGMICLFLMRERLKF